MSSYKPYIQQLTFNQVLDTLTPEERGPFLVWWIGHPEFMFQLDWQKLVVEAWREGSREPSAPIMDKPPTKSGRYTLDSGNGQGTVTVDVYDDTRADGRAGLRIQGPRNCDVNHLRPFETEADWWLEEVLVTLTVPEAKALYRLIDELSGGNVESVWPEVHQVSDTDQTVPMVDTTDPTQTAVAVITKAAGRTVPEEL